MRYSQLIPLVWFEAGRSVFIWKCNRYRTVEDSCCSGSGLPQDSLIIFISIVFLLFFFQVGIFRCIVFSTLRPFLSGLRCSRLWQRDHLSYGQPARWFDDSGIYLQAKWYKRFRYSAVPLGVVWGGAIWGCFLGMHWWEVEEYDHWNLGVVWWRLLVDCCVFKMFRCV